MKKSAKIPMRILLGYASLLLAGCSTVGGAGSVRPDLPALPKAATALCARPPLTRLGDDLGIKAAEWRATAICERGKRAALITFYNRERKGLAGR